MVAESLELAVSPGIQDPVLDTAVGVLCLVLGLIPRTSDLRNQRVFVRVGRILDVDALLLQVRRQLVSIPVLVRGDGIGVPVV